MKTKLYIVSAVIFAAIGLSFFFSPTASAAPICGDTDFTGPCVAPVAGCGDRGFVGPCAPLDYSTVNCDTAFRNSYEGPSRCRAVKQCITQRGLTSAVCVQQWNTCRDAVANAQGRMKSVDREGCMSAVQTGTPYSAAGTDDNKTSCAVEGIGWIICPVMRFLAQLVDQAYGMVSLLLTVPAIDTSTNSPMYSAWSVMRNFANAAFVMAFLIIIYSQMTGAGINNYGIKKMLPRLIVAAILVNISYWICAIAVDLSNIAGVSLKGLLEGTANQLYTPGGGTESGAGGLWDGLTVGLIGAAGVAAALYVGLSALLPMLIAAAFAIAAAVLVLTLRQAFIIILIVVSPIAFVARLLPNTENIYGLWQGGFKALLIIYPAAGVVFGGSALASTIITNAAGGNFILQVMGAGVTVLPLFAVPLLTKSVNTGLNRVGVRLNDPMKGPIDGLKRRAEGFRGNRQQLRDARALNGGHRFGKSLVRRNARRQAVLSQRERNYNNAKAGYVADSALSDEVSRGQRALSWATAGDLGGKTKGEQLVNQMAKGGGDGGRSAALAQAVSVQAKIEAEEVQAASAVIKHMNLDRNQQAMRDLSMGGAAAGLDGSNAAVRAAAMKNVVDSHDVDGVNQLLDNVGAMDVRTREAFADSLASSSQKPEYVGQSAISNIRQHGNLDASGAPIVAQNSTQLAATAINNNTYSVSKLATGDREELEFIAKIAADPTIATNNTNIAKNASDAKTDPRFSGQIGKNINVVDDISNL